MNPARLLITLVTYNERENLPRLLPLIQEQCPQADVLVVDDNSPDGTGVWCDEQARTDPRLRCLHRVAKEGIGSATVAALRFGVEEGYDLVLNLDADLSHDPRYIPSLLAALSADQADVAIGSRYVLGGGIQGWPWSRRLMSRGVNAYARWALGLPLRDCSGAFRCFRTAVLAKVPWREIQARGYAFEEELLWRLKRAGARFVEVPIVFVDRRQGQSKSNVREAASALATLLWLGVENWRGTGPKPPPETG